MSRTIFYAADFHGADVVWKKFINAGRFYGADVLIMGGDLTGKAVVPIVAGNGSFTVKGLGGEQVVSPDEVAVVEQQIRDKGLYPRRLLPEELEALQGDNDAMARVFMDAMTASLERWLDLAAERLKGTGIELFVMLGNDDEPSLDELLSSSTYGVNCEDRVVDLGEGFEMVSCGWANPTPWDSPRELPDSELGARMEAMVRQLRDPASAVFNFHVPPYGTQLDLAPKLDSSLKPMVQGGQFLVESVGSAEVRRLIETYQPALGVHGHIHEARGATRLGRTLCVNPGSVYGEGVLHGALIELRRGQKVKYQLTAG